MSGARDVEVHCRSTAGGWSCEVTVRAGRSASRHVVAVRQEDLHRLDPGAAEPTDLVRRSFGFLLEREPMESILASFDLPVISRYFPEYETEISRG